MAFQVTAPIIGAVTITPAQIAINDTVTISAEVTEGTITVDYVWPYSGTVYSGEEVLMWL